MIFALGELFQVARLCSLFEFHSYFNAFLGLYCFISCIYYLFVLPLIIFWSLVRPCWLFELYTVLLHISSLEWLYLLYYIKSLRRSVFIYPDFHYICIIYWLLISGLIYWLYKSCASWLLLIYWFIYYFTYWFKVLDEAFALCDYLSFI